MSEEMRQKLLKIQGCLAHEAAKPEDAKRRRDENGDDESVYGYVLDPFEIDVYKLMNCKALRRLQGKTQVVSMPSNAHTRNRASHTIEVVSNANAIAAILGLNQNLCRAMAFGHDIGHVPFGHYGERFIAKRTGRRFKHYEFSVIVAQKIERRGYGLNLTRQTLRGMLNHSRGNGDLKSESMTPEESAVMYADKISYLFSDYNDLFVRNSLLGTRFEFKDYPGLKEAMGWFGANQRQRVYRCVGELCLESAERGKVSFIDCEAAQRFRAAMKIMYQAYSSIPWKRVTHMLEGVFDILAEIGECRDAALLMALMTDRDVEYLNRRAVHIDMNLKECLRSISLGDNIEYLKGISVDIADPDMDW